MKRFKLLYILTVLSLFSACAERDELLLVRKGSSDYSIFVDPSAPESVIQAAADLQSYFMKVSGASPELVVGNEDPPTPFISLGSTSALKDAGLDATGIPNEGFRILTREGNIYIFGSDTPEGEVNELGNMSKGTSYGVYTFIEDYLGVEWLMPGDLGEEYEKTSSVSVPFLDYTESSPFSYRYMSFRLPGPHEDDWDRHMKLGKREEVEFNHSWTETIPPSLYDEHPDWFAQKNGKRLPPSGDKYKLETTNPELVQAFADVIIETFRRNPDQRWYSLSPNDGGGGWSDSPASKALTENVSPDKGSSSISPLILKFYNDVAKIVKSEFPDHQLGGFLYGLYRYPPNHGLQKLAPNLALMLVGRTQHWRLYRPNMQGINDELIRIWGEYAKRDGFGIYYYDYPISMMMPNAIIPPPSPDHLNFIFSRLSKYEYKGAQIYGNPIWPVSGASNYILAKLLWNPDQDAQKLLNHYCEKAFGVEAGPNIVKIYDILDTAYNHFYNDYTNAGSALTAGHLKEIYAEHYEEMEEYFLKARSGRKNTKQEERLELFGQVLSLMQWHLRDNGFLNPDFESPLTKGIEEIDLMLAAPQHGIELTRKMLRSIQREDPFMVETCAPLADAANQKAVSVPLFRKIRMLIHVTNPGEVAIKVKAFDGNNEFVRFTITDSEGQLLSQGVISDGRTIRFTGEAGENYILDIPNRSASAKLEAEGAIIAYKAGNLGIDKRFMDEDLPLYFFVPKEIQKFSVTLGTREASADIYSPDGKKAGSLRGISRKLINRTDSRGDFWKLVIHKTDGSGRISVEFDDQLPPWIIPDPAHPIIVSIQD